MALWDIQAFGTEQEAINYLDDALVGSVNLHEGAAVDGLTVIIDAGGGPITVTFTPALSRPWTIEEIVSKINGADASLADVAHIEVLAPYQTSAPLMRRLQILKDAAITVDKDGTANALLGLPTVADWVRDQILDTEVVSVTRHSGEQTTWIVVTYR